MKVQVEVDVLASDWHNLICTFIEGGAGREWWREVEVQTCKLRHPDNPNTMGDGKWITANYGCEHVYREPRAWRIILRLQKEYVGSKATDGKKWGWGGVGCVLQREYVLMPAQLARVANLAPDLFGEWLGSGERNLTTAFDANCADSFMQLAAFGVEVFG